MLEEQGDVEFPDVVTGKCRRWSVSDGLFTVLQSRSLKEGAMPAS